MTRTLTTEYSHVNEEKTKLTVLYARLSKDDGKAGDSDSILNQKLLLENFAKNNHFANCRFFSDDGISGTTFQRPAFEEAIELVNAGKVATFIVKDLSRFGRDYLKVGAFTEVIFPEKDVRFIAIANNIDSEKQEDNSLAPFINLFNEWYARDTSKKIKAVKHAKGNAGEPIGGSLPYGYLKGENYKQTKVWLVDEEAAEIVRRIFREYSQGQSLMMIAEGLEQDKILIPARHKLEIGEHVALVGQKPYLWSYDVISYMLENQAYTGCVVNFKTYKKSYKSKKCLPNPRENWKIFPGHHQAIVDQETFDLVQQLRNSSRPRRTNGKCIGLFSNLVFCLDCGHKHHFTEDKSRKTGAYFCSGRASRLHYCESYHRILERDLKALVAKDFRRIQQAVSEKNSVFEQELRKKFALDDTREIALSEKALKVADARLNELDQIIQKLYEDNVSGKISDERFAKMSANFEAEQTELSRQAVEFREKFATSTEQSQNVDKFLNMVRQSLSLDNLTPEVVRELLERIEIGEKQTDQNGNQTQEVKLFYRFVGEIKEVEEKDRTIREIAEPPRTERERRSKTVRNKSVELSGVV